MNQRADILIIGGGLSGTMLAVQLLRLPGRRHVLIIEPRAEIGRGEAYSAVELGHTLNGNAARMSVDPDNPDDLTQWLTEHITAGGWPESAEQNVPVSELFPPRGLFGVYVQQRLAEARRVGAQQLADPGGRPRPCRGRELWQGTACGSGFGRGKLGAEPPRSDRYRPILIPVGSRLTAMGPPISIGGPLCFWAGRDVRSAFAKFVSDMWDDPIYGTKTGSEKTYARWRREAGTGR